MEERTSPAETLVIRLVGPAAALASGLVTGMAGAAPGDLDPDFGDVGRALGLPALEGSAWSIEVADEGDALIAGFEEYCYYDCSFEGFAARLQEDGTLDPGFAAARLAATDVFDVALQSDGKSVGIGATHVPEPNRPTQLRLTAFRLNRDGSLDTTFGAGGLVRLDAGKDVRFEGKSLVIDAEGRAVVAATRGDRRVVLRLAADGSVDRGFGEDGEFVGPFVSPSGPPLRIVAVPGGYRVSAPLAIASSAGAGVLRCRILGVTSTGAADGDYGSDGRADPFATSLGTSDGCAALVSPDDGSLLVDGHRRDELGSVGMAARLQPGGAIDPGFSGAAVSAALREATAIAVDSRGKISVAGYGQAGLRGGTVVRLQANGLLDSLFGQDGRTSFNLPSSFGGNLTVNDMKALPGGALLLGGGDYSRSSWAVRPYAVRLLGDDAGGGPGVLEVETPQQDVLESSGHADVVVRRIGGRTGAVSVAYSSRPASDQGYGRATAGEDYTPVRGRLEWADGDDAPKTFTIPITSGGAAYERVELFTVGLSDAEGGAGLGQQEARIQILGDGCPAGAFSIEGFESIVNEGSGAATA
jgi:uncharacterized delta-60 repeat protein